MDLLSLHRLRTVGKYAAHSLCGFVVAFVIVQTNCLNSVRTYLERSSLQLDELLFLFVLPLAVSLTIAYRSQRALHAAAIRRERERDVARQQACHDPLTGLLNRRGLDDALHLLPIQESRVYLVDIDGFKQLNDEHGHAEGDALLQCLANRLQALTKKFGLVAARMGGDEFIVVASVDPETNDAVERALNAMLPHRAGSLSLSVGMADFGDGNFASALEQADAAMYEAKRRNQPAGRDGNRLFEAQLATGHEPAEGYCIIAIAVNRVDDGGKPMSYGQAGPLTRAVQSEIQRVLPGLTIERLSNDILGIAVPAPDLTDVTATLRQISATCLLDDMEHQARLTFGRAGPAPRLQLREVVEQAQLAVERARRSGCDLVDFQEGDRIALRANAALLRDLRLAIRDDALALHFQPKLNLRTNAIDSLEALVRWTHPQLGAVSPGQFVPLAEDSGDIRALTHWVFSGACRASSSLQQAGHAQVIYVNVSALLIADDAFADSLIAEAVTAGAHIGVEVTETACLQQPEKALENLRRIAAAGLKIAIDDYGVGLSSLTYLRQMPASELKIDMSFIRDLAESHRDPLIVRSTIDLAHGLGLKVTAEGVDKAETLALLKVMGCDFAQGFHIAPAYALPQCLEFLANWTTPDTELPDYASELRRFIQPVAQSA